MGTARTRRYSRLGWDHFLPESDRRRNQYIVTACRFCNTADNRCFDPAEKRGLRFDGLTPDQLVAQRLPYVEATGSKYKEFWSSNVCPTTPDQPT